MWLNELTSALDKAARDNKNYWIKVASRPRFNISFFILGGSL